MIEITKQEALSLLMLLSALESWSLSCDKPIPEPIQLGIDHYVELFSKKLLGEDDE